MVEYFTHLKIDNENEEVKVGFIFQNNYKKNKYEYDAFKYFEDNMPYEVIEKVSIIIKETQIIVSPYYENEYFIKYQSFEDIIMSLSCIIS